VKVTRSAKKINNEDNYLPDHNEHSDDPRCSKRWQVGSERVEWMFVAGICGSVAMDFDSDHLDDSDDVVGRAVGIVFLSASPSSALPFSARSLLVELIPNLHARSSVDLTATGDTSKSRRFRKRSKKSILTRLKRTSQKLVRAELGDALRRTIHSSTTTASESSQMVAIKSIATLPADYPSDEHPFHSSEPTCTVCYTEGHHYVPCDRMLSLIVIAALLVTFTTVVPRSMESI